MKRILLIAVYGWFFPLFANAQVLDNNVSINSNTQKYANKSGFGTDIGGQAGLSQYLALILKSFLSLMGIIFIILIIYAGFTWMTAGGDEQKVSKAKSTIGRAAIGLFIVLAAYAITAFVFGAIEGGSGGYPSSPAG